MMENRQISQHISRQFNAELEDVRERVLAMGGLVEEQITDALNALVHGNAELANKAIITDRQVNQMELQIDEECTRILAKRQPAASDLRLVVAIIKTITDLERIGDEANKIGRMAAHLAGELQGLQTPRQQFNAVMKLGQQVKKMMHDALDAFARMDVTVAVRVAQEEKGVDDEYNALLRQLITYMMEDPRSISGVLDVIWSARALERIGDHARNICEYVVYLVRGTDVRHQSIEKMIEEAKKAT